MLIAIYSSRLNRGFKHIQPLTEPYRTKKPKNYNEFGSCYASGVVGDICDACRCVCASIRATLSCIVLPSINNKSKKEMPTKTTTHFLMTCA